MATRKLSPLPPTTQPHDFSRVLRTDFSDDDAWQALCEAIEAPQTEDDFQANVEFLSDRHYEGATVDELLSISPYGFMFIVDSMAITHPDHPIVVLDLNEKFGQPGRNFRVIPSEMWAVENNLRLANMDFHEFSDHVDSDGIYRGCE